MQAEYSTVTRSHRRACCVVLVSVCHLPGCFKIPRACPGEFQDAWLHATPYDLSRARSAAGGRAALSPASIRAQRVYASFVACHPNDPRGKPGGFPPQRCQAISGRHKGPGRQTPKHPRHDEIRISKHTNSLGMRVSDFGFGVSLGIWVLGYLGISALRHQAVAVTHT